VPEHAIRQNSGMPSAPWCGQFCRIACSGTIFGII